MSKAANPYGDGEASRRICEAIRFYFKQTDEKPDAVSVSFLREAKE